MLLTGPSGTNLGEKFELKYKIFIEENQVKNVICKMMAILSQPQCDNHCLVTCHRLVFFDEANLD